MPTDKSDEQIVNGRETPESSVQVAASATLSKEAASSSRSGHRPEKAAEANSKLEQEKVLPALQIESAESLSTTGSSGKPKIETISDPDVNKQGNAENALNRLTARLEQFKTGDVTVKGNPDGLLRQYTVGDTSVTLIKGDGYFYGKEPQVNGTVKIHVTTTDPEDLGKLQKVLIPELVKDPELSQLVQGWKTEDPLYGLGLPGGGAKPTGADQGAKGFTIYTKDPSDALLVQQRLNQILTENHLGLSKPFDTDNVDQIIGSSNRVGLTRDLFDLAQLDDGKTAALVDPNIQKDIRKQFNLPDGTPLSPAQLSQVEEEAGLRPGTLVNTGTGDPGELALLTQSPQSKVVDGGIYPPGQEYTFGYAYLDESQASKKPGDLTDRPAMYALYRHFGLDPAIAATAGDKQPTDLLLPGADGNPNDSPSGAIILGRDHPGTVDPNDNLISREQAEITTDSSFRLYIRDLNSTNGTYVNGQKIPPGQPVPIGPQDRVTLGSANGTPLKLQFSDNAAFQPTPIGTIKSVNDPEIDLRSLPLQPPNSKDLITVTENIPKGIDLDVPPYAAPGYTGSGKSSSDTSGIPPSVATDSGLGGIIDIAPAVVAAAI